MFDKFCCRNLVLKCILYALESLFHKSRFERYHICFRKFILKVLFQKTCSKMYFIFLEDMF